MVSYDDPASECAWYHQDDEAAWSFPKPWKGSTWGYKVHTLLCRWSELPIMFLVTSDNRHDGPLAIPLLSLAVACFGCPIAIVRADAAYFSYALLDYLGTVLHAGFVIDYNLRKHGKKAMATLPFIRQWRFHLKFRAVIERHFAWVKRYFGLEAARWKGLIAAYQHTALVYSVILGVALTLIASSALSWLVHGCGSSPSTCPFELPNPLLFSSFLKRTSRFTKH
jgi:hypothetical protein